MWLADERQGCPSCSFLVDNIGHLSHLHARNITLVLVLRGPLAELLVYRERMGWTVPWFSSLGSTFNYDFHVTIDPAVAPVEYNFKDQAQLEAENVAWRDWSGEQPGISAFLRHGDRVFHTYSSYARGGDLLIGTYNWLDLTALAARRTSRSPPAAATARSWPGSAATTSTAHPTDRVPGVRFMYQYPETIGPDGDMLSAGPVTELAQAAEAAGWEGFAFTEHPVPGSRWLSNGGHQTLDPFVALGHAAAVTERMQLLTYLAVLPYRNPMLLAKSAATVDLLSNGRFILGVGTGYQKAEFHALGVDFDERNDALRRSPRRAADALERRAVQLPGPSLRRPRRDRAAQARPPAHPDLDRRQRHGHREPGRRPGQGWMPLTSHVDISATTRTPHLGSVDDLAKRITALKERAGDAGRRDRHRDRVHRSFDRRARP